MRKRPLWEGTPAVIEKPPLRQAGRPKLCGVLLAFHGRAVPPRAEARDRHACDEHSPLARALVVLLTPWANRWEAMFIPCKLLSRLTCDTFGVTAHAAWVHHSVTRASKG